MVIIKYWWWSSMMIVADFPWVGWGLDPSLFFYKKASQTGVFFQNQCIGSYPNFWDSIFHPSLSELCDFSQHVCNNKFGLCLISRDPTELHVFFFPEISIRKGCFEIVGYIYIYIYLYTYILYTMWDPKDSVQLVYNYTNYGLWMFMVGK